MSDRTETHYIDGRTTEGYPFNVQLRFRARAPDGEMPLEVAAWYQAGDGPGTVVLERNDKGLYTYAGDDSIAKYGDISDAIPNNLMPAVITEGTWGRPHNEH